MIQQKLFKLFLGIIFILILGCDPLPEREKFQRPEWLPGKLYTTVAVQEDLTMFAECLRLSGLDTILDVSGSWTVFAPDDDAIEQYLIENKYGSIADIPQGEMSRLVRFHIVQNPWSLEQLQILSSSGWRDGNNDNLESFAYKRQTILKNPIDKYWILRKDKMEKIVLDSTITNAYKKIFVGSRKYVPIYYDEFVDINGISSADYGFYFDREYEHGNVYFAGARIIHSDIFAENGFVHIIDKVIKPMMNAKELLERDLPGESYKLFLEMIYWYYPSFAPDMDATLNQPELRYGGEVDTLWELNYTDLPFDLHNERTGIESATLNETLIRHNGMFIPTDEAFSGFLDGTLTSKSGFPHWFDYKALPKDIVRLLIPPHIVSAPLYPSSQNYQQVFVEDSRFRQNEGDIIRKEFGSNCTFIGLDSYIPDKVFTSVCGPVFLRPSFTSFRLAMQYTGLYDAIATHQGDLSFFPLSDYSLGPDSSMILNWIDKDELRYSFKEWNRYQQRFDNLSSGAIRSRILNQVGTSLPNGSANKEFIPTLGGNYIIWNNEENTVQGNLPCTIGFNGEVVTTCNPVLMDEPTDNGHTWNVKYWFNFRVLKMQSVLYRYNVFFELLDKAGLLNSKYDLNFISNNGSYTVFVPSDEALNAYQADTLNTEDLADLLKHHFVEGVILFTDNKQPSGSYPTRGSANLNIRMAPDLIEILDENGNVYVSIPENENTTNIMVSEGSTVSSVVHEIDEVLIH